MANSGLSLLGSGLTITDAAVSSSASGFVNTFSGDTTGLTPATPTGGAVVLGGILIGANGGTGVANTGKTMTIGASLTTTGAGAPTLAFPASPATYTYPAASQTLASLAGTETLTSKTFTMPIIGIDTWANIIAASAVTGQFAYASNVGNSGTLLRYSGTRWKPVNLQTILNTLDTASSTVTNSEAVVFQYQMPINFWQVGDVLRFYFFGSKTGVTDTGTVRIRIGTLGTTSDNTVASSASFIGASTLQYSAVIDLRLATVTATQQMPLTPANFSYGVSNSALPAVVVMNGNASTQALFFNFTLLSSGTTATLALQAAQLVYLASAN